MTISHRVGLLLFPKITQLDLAGPYEVFCRMPGAAVHLLWKDTQLIKSEWGLELRPDTTFEFLRSTSSAFRVGAVYSSCSTMIC